MESEVRPIFVLGAPRSGTTMIGNYIGSGRSVLNVGEYRAFYVTQALVPEALEGGISPPEWFVDRARYLQEVQGHAKSFIEKIAREKGCRSYCDATPRNIHVGRKLAALLPSALFILTLRHYTGVLQSLARHDFEWIEPKTWPARAQVWVSSYNSAAFLPRDRTIPFSYDRLCADPAETIDRFNKRLQAAGVDVSELDSAVFARSHATRPGDQRPTVSVRTGEGNWQLQPIPSYDRAAWTDHIQAQVTPLVASTDDLLGLMYPDTYSAPAGYASASAATAP